LAIGYKIILFRTPPKKDDDKDNSDNDVVKLLKTMDSANGYMKYEYEYDGQNRITKRSIHEDGEIYSTETFTYSGDDLVKIVHANPNYPDYKYETVFEKTGNAITFDDGGTLTLNNDGYPTRYLNECESGDCSDESIYEYKDGNLTKSTYSTFEYGSKFSEDVYEFNKYDDKKSPFLHCKTPKWAMIFFITTSLKNNATETKYKHNGEDITIKSQYEYDRDGYPTKQTGTANGITAISTYTYK
jgi:hypothetical protein